MTDADHPEWRIAVPGHVVHRAFDAETVVLNVATGTYHSLNPTAARMLAALQSTGTIAGAVAAMLSEFEVDRRQLERDLVAFCRELADRGLVVLTEINPRSR